MPATIIQGDALAELKKLQDQSFAAVVTSPPYNLGTTNPVGKRGQPTSPGYRRRWSGDYAGDFDDNLSVAGYIAYHRQCLTQILRLLKTDGLLWYVHRRKPDFAGRQSLLSAVIEGFPFRTEIVWDKGGPGVGFCAAGVDGGAYYPTPGYESVLLLLGKEKSAVLDRKVAAAGDVWRIPASGGGGLLTRRPFRWSWPSGVSKRLWLKAGFLTPSPEPARWARQPCDRAGTLC